ncbi:hypothetical protein L2E82_04406 [Cichorium intybus]|uniref:Uncharacterized protein n=1 Tax=Cichorium intybus TaxID=13427 RepID=A0ACB9H5D6_CICIN|nr:hypothetical protein L2E82_04406 [Cichorium intybus]
MKRRTGIVGRVWRVEMAMRRMAKEGVSDNVMKEVRMDYPWKMPRFRGFGVQILKIESNKEAVERNPLKASQSRRKSHTSSDASKPTFLTSHTPSNTGIDLPQTERQFSPRLRVVTSLVTQSHSTRSLISLQRILSDSRISTLSASLKLPIIFCLPHALAGPYLDYDVADNQYLLLSSSRPHIRSMIFPTTIGTTASLTINSLKAHLV